MMIYDNPSCLTQFFRLNTKGKSNNNIFFVNKLNEPTLNIIVMCIVYSVLHTYHYHNTKLKVKFALFTVFFFSLKIVIFVITLFVHLLLLF